MITHLSQLSPVQPLPEGSMSGGWRPKATQAGGDLGGRIAASSRVANSEKIDAVGPRHFQSDKGRGLGSFLKDEQEKDGQRDGLHRTPFLFLLSPLGPLRASHSLIY